MMRRLLPRIINRMHQWTETPRLAGRLAFSGRPRAYLFGVPRHPNLGDHAQTWCIRRWISDNYPECELVEFYWRTSHARNLDMLARTIRPGERIYFHSGYLFVDHHLELPVYREVVRRFVHNPILIFPQTIHFKDKKLESDMFSALDAHGDVTLLCRDRVSYARALKLARRCRIDLYPDIVTTLIGSRGGQRKGDGVLLCLRNDIEAHHSRDDLERLLARFRSSVRAERFDTSIDLTSLEMERTFDRRLRETLDYFAGFQVVVTDRYHGTIFSLIAGTPVVVLASADHKLSSGVTWFERDYADRVCFAGDLEAAYARAQRYLAEERPAPPAPVMKARYYDRLKALIESVPSTAEPAAAAEVQR